LQKARNITPKIGLIALVSTTYAMVAGGPFGLEDIVKSSGYGLALFVICILTPLLWGLPTTLMVSEMASALPETGGFYVWATRALGPFWGFQESWLSFAGSIFDMAIYPILFSTYLAHLMPKFGSGHTPFLIGVVMIVVCAAMNLLGTHFVGEESIYLVLLLLAPFAILVWVGFRAAPALASSQHLTKPDLLAGILVAMWNYMGWDNASTIAGDVKNARRTYSIAMTATLALVIITYMLPILAVKHAGIPASAWETGAWVTLAGRLGGEKLSLFVTAAGMLGALTTFNAYVLALSRVPYAMALKGYLPKVFAKENSRGAPWFAIIACSVFWALATILSFEATVMLDVLLTGLSILVEFAALVALRIKEPDLPRFFRVKGGLGVAIFLGIPPAVLIGVSCVRNHTERLGPVNALTVGLILIALGVVFWFVGERQRKSTSGSQP
jgi:amino acid transporter